MDNNEQNIFNGLKEKVQEQIKEAYMAGAHEGAIAAAATIYSVMASMGLEETNILFDLLRDIAKQHGCDDLKTKVAAMRNKTDA